MTDFLKLGSGYLVLVSIKQIDKKDVNLTDVTKRSLLTYSHVFKAIKHLTSRGMVFTRFSGRDRFVKLTKKGDTIATYLVLMSKEMGVQK